MSSCGIYLQRTNFSLILIYEDTNKDDAGSSKLSLRYLRSRLQKLVTTRQCNHCKLIDSGDVALYQITCPECGDVPPSRKHLYPGLTSTNV